MIRMVDGFARASSAAGAPMRGPVGGPMDDPARAAGPGAVSAIQRLTGWRRLGLAWLAGALVLTRRTSGVSSSW